MKIFHEVQYNKFAQFFHEEDDFSMEKEAFYMLNFIQLFHFLFICNHRLIASSSFIFFTYLNV